MPDAPGPADKSDIDQIVMNLAEPQLLPFFVAYFYVFFQALKNKKKIYYLSFFFGISWLPKNICS